MIALDHFPNFEGMVDKRSRELDEMHAQIAASLAAGADNMHRRMKSPRLNTTPPVVREMALKKRIIDKLDRLKELAPTISEVVFSLHVDEIELALVMEQRCASATEYWRRLADGPIYAGGRAFLDLLNERGISATHLASLSIAEIDAVTKYVQGALDRKSSRKGHKA